VVWGMTMLHYLGTDNRGVGVEWFFLAVLVRDVVLVGLAVLVAREALRPDDDVVRTTWPGVDDPAGGVLDGSRDVLVLGRGSGLQRGAQLRDLLGVRGGVPRGLQDDGAAGGARDVDQ
jgi:hypothetical protein